MGCDTAQLSTQRQWFCIKCLTLSATLHGTVFQKTRTFKYCAVYLLHSQAEIWTWNVPNTKQECYKLHLLRLSQLWLTIPVFWTCCCTTRWVVRDVSKDQSACIFRAMQFQKLLHPEDAGTMIPSNVRWNYSSTNTLPHTRWFQHLTAMRFSRFSKVSSEKLWSTFTHTQSLPLLHHPVIYNYPTNYISVKYCLPSY
jgi:hypothetical protein